MSFEYAKQIVVKEKDASQEVWTEFSKPSLVELVLTPEQAERVVSSLQYAIEEAKEHQALWNVHLCTLDDHNRIDIIINPHQEKVYDENSTS